jgi:hypothetical protein
MKLFSITTLTMFTLSSIFLFIVPAYAFPPGYSSQPGSVGEREEICGKISDYVSASMMKSLLDLSENPVPEKKEKFQNIYKDFYQIKCFLISNQISNPGIQEETREVWRNFYRQQAKRYNLDFHVLDNTGYRGTDFNQVFGYSRWWSAQRKTDQHNVDKFMMEIEERVAQEDATSITDLEAAKANVAKIDREIRDNDEQFHKAMDKAISDFETALPNARIADIKPGLQQMVISGKLTKDQVQEVLDYFRLKGHPE